MDPPEVEASALELIAQGINDCEISRRMGIPRGAIRDWGRPTYVPRNERPGWRLLPDLLAAPPLSDSAARAR